MTGQIRYTSYGNHYFVNGAEVDKSTYDMVFPSKCAEMFESGQAPACITDATFMRGHCNGSQFEKNPKIGEALAKQARKRGVDTKGKRYLGSLARYPGDPKAWVDGRGDVKRVLEERGWGAEGVVNASVREPYEEPASLAGDIAPDILEREANRVIAVHGPVKDKRELKEQIREKHRPKKDPRPLEPLRE